MRREITATSSGYFGKRCLTAFCSIIALALMVPVANAASLTIDDFSDVEVGTTQTASQTGVGTTSDSDTGLSGVIGGNRDLFVDITADPNPAGGSTNVFTNTTRLSVSLGDDVDGTGGSEYPGLGGVDLTLGELPANAYFQAKVLSADSNVILNVEIEDSGNTATFTSAALVAGGFVNQALGSFTNAGLVDFTSVDRIRITLSGPTAFDASIDLLEITTTPGAVPEPSTYALGAIGLVGMVGFAVIRRRRAA